MTGRMTNRVLDWIGGRDDPWPWHIYLVNRRVGRGAPIKHELELIANASNRDPRMTICKSTFHVP